MKKKMKYLFILLGSLMLSGCISGGYGIEGSYKVYTKNTTYEKIQTQMVACGLPINLHDMSKLYAIPDDEYIKANVCMEKHGFRGDSVSICATPLGKDAGGELCKEWLKEFKPCYFFCEGSSYDDNDEGAEIIRPKGVSEEQENKDIQSCKKDPNKQIEGSDFASIIQPCLKQKGYRFRRNE